MTHFNANTITGQILELLRDLEWHCAAHEMPGSQPASHIRDLRKGGYQVETERADCPVCGAPTTHNRLTTLEMGPQVAAEPATPASPAAPTSLFRLESAIRQIDRAVESGSWDGVRVGLEALKTYAQRMRDERS